MTSRRLPHTPTRLFLALLLLVVGATAVRANTVEYVTISTTGANGAVLSGFEMRVSDSRISGFRMPFIAGQGHRVVIIGHLTDMLDRLEITHGSRVVRSIKKGNGLDASHTSKYGGKGAIVFTLNPSDLPSVGDDFQLRVRFATELAGYDKLDCKVIRRGTVRKVEWTTANGASLPTFGVKDGVRRASLTTNGIYSLKLTGDGFGTTSQVFDGRTRRILGQPVTAFSATTTSLEVTFKYENIQRDPAGNAIIPTNDVTFCDDEAGNIEGGWGPYIYYALLSPLPAASEGTNVTDLKNLCHECISTIRTVDRGVINPTTVPTIPRR